MGESTTQPDQNPAAERLKKIIAEDVAAKREPKIPLGDETTVKVYDRDNIVRQVNGWSKAITDGIKVAESDPELSKLLESARAAKEKGQEPEASQVKMMEQFSTHEGRKEILASLGVNDKTPDSYRLVAYNDHVKAVIFKATAEDDGTLILTHSKMISDSKGGVDVDGILTMYGGEFKQLPEPIVLPKTPTLHLKGNNGLEGEELLLTPEQKKGLEAKVTLIALADQAMNGAVASVDSHAAMPYRQTGLSESRTA